MNKTDKILVVVIVLIFLALVIVMGLATMMFYEEFGVFPWQILSIIR